MATTISSPPQAYSIPSTSTSPQLSIMSTDVLLPHIPPPASDTSNTLTPRSRTLLIKQAQKLQRILGETPHVQLAIDLSGPTRPSAAVIAKRRNTLTMQFPLPLPSPPLTSPSGTTLTPKPSMPTITFTAIPRPPSPPPSPSSIRFSPTHFRVGSGDSDSEPDTEALERRRTRARLAKIQRWTGENVPASLIAPARRSADERRTTPEQVHARSKSVFIAASPVRGGGRGSLEKKDAELAEIEQVPQLLSSDAPTKLDTAVNAAASEICPVHGKEMRRTAKLSRFFGVPATQLPAPLPSLDTITDAHRRAATEPATNGEVHLPRSRSFSSTSGGHSHSLSLSGSSQMGRTMTPFSEYSYDSDENSDGGVEVRIKCVRGRVGRTAKKDGVHGRLGEMEREQYAVVMDKLRRMK